MKFNSLNELVEYHRTASVSRSQEVRLRDLHLNEVKIDILFLNSLVDSTILSCHPKIWNWSMLRYLTLGTSKLPPAIFLHNQPWANSAYCVPISCGWLLSASFKSVVFLFQNLVQALYDFTPQEPGELAFSRGDVIKVTDKTDMHWWKGEIGNREGLFPATYVQPYH